MTLLEIVVAVAILGLVTAVTLPSFATPTRDAASIGQVVRLARSQAIGRAQVLALQVETSGRWQLRSSDGLAIDSGRLDMAPRLGIEFSPSGHCRLTTPMPATWSAWDVARCHATDRSR